MKIAIVGGGLAGVALAWQLLDLRIEVSLFDPKGIGGGASSVAAGLLHPYVGKRALLSSHGHEAFAAANELLQIAESEEKVCLRTGIFRPAITEEQKKDFRETVLREEGRVSWEEKLEGVASGLWIPEGVTVFTQKLLQALWALCEKKGGQFLQKQWEGEGDRVVFATGADTKDLFPQLPLKVNKGQLLVCRWKEPLFFSLASEGHISPTESPSLCQVGSTYEHGILTREADPALALPLLEKVSQFYPKAKDFEVVEVRAGWRAAPIHGHLPLTVRIDPKTWVFSGLGSRGLLYANWCAKRLAREVVA